MEYLSEFEFLTESYREGLETQRIAFKKFSLECTAAGINIQPLTKLLSTIYGQLMVTRGYIAMMSGTISTSLSLSRQEEQVLKGYLEMMLEENHLSDLTLMSAQDGLETKLIEVV